MVYRVNRYELYHPALRPSVLGRAIGRKALTLIPRNADEDVGDEASPSNATAEHIRTYLDAWPGTSDAPRKDGLNDIVRTWRADNAAGGVPVYAHLPLPATFATTLARLVDETGGTEKQHLLDNVAAELDPSVRTLVKGQLAAAIDENDARRVARPEQRTTDDMNEEHPSNGEAARHDLSRPVHKLSADYAEYTAPGQPKHRTFTLGTPVSAARAAPSRPPQFGEPNYDGADDANWREQPGRPRVPGAAIVRDGDRSTEEYPPRPRRKPKAGVPGAHPKIPTGRLVPAVTSRLWRSG
jgi:protein required for attachment to host cells